MTKKLTICLMLYVPMMFGQYCSSFAASLVGGWKPIASAPRDGTPVEVLETYGIAPTYGLSHWTKDIIGLEPDGKFIHYPSAEPQWVSISDPGSWNLETICLFWRPYKGEPSKYKDPTNGIQKTTAYWCAAMHMPYDKKKDRCIP